MLDGRRVCAQHATDDDRAVVAVIDAHGSSLGLRPDRRGRSGWDRWRWPYGANIDVEARLRLVVWAQEHELRLSYNAHRCLRWLRTGRCWGCADGLRFKAATRSDRASDSATLRTLVTDPAARLPRATWIASGRWCDHLTAWTHNGDPAVIVAQPYDLDEVDEQELAAIGADRDFDVRIETGGWYGHGTRFVGIWRAA